MQESGWSLPTALRPQWRWISRRKSAGDFTRSRNRLSPDESFAAGQFLCGITRRIKPERPKKREIGTKRLVESWGCQSNFFRGCLSGSIPGYTLTQASDLTVRGGSVFLKTLGGLVGVDSILRRIPDIDCDPLELNTSSPIGIPGLCQASRDQQVRLANQLGSGWAESPALTAILPELCQAILGEELKLGNAPMHWCGRPENVEAVLREPERYVIRNSFCRHSRMDWDFQLASDESRAKFKAELLASPGALLRWKDLSQAVHRRGMQTGCGLAHCNPSICCGNEPRVRSDARRNCSFGG